MKSSLFITKKVPFYIAEALLHYNKYFHRWERLLKTPNIDYCLYILQVYISVQKRYLFPPSLLKTIFYPSLMLFCDSYSGLFALFYPFISPFLFFFPLLPFSFHFLPFSLQFSFFLFHFSYFFPQMTLANIPPPREEGIFQNIDP
jgi:hypothetical protein